ncbi:MAG: hypothetical protein J2P15_03285 [Micromonosporaceae bacterium]|nr:hypothetical protein [Micromonosporaceae bacterium]
MTRPAARYRTDLVMAVLGSWFIIGAFLDAWAHNNLLRLETFFTPWHAVLYSGFVACAAWIGWTGRQGTQTMPAAYPTGLVGVAIFAVSGVGDFAWHSFFGIEQNIKILFSPSHLGLATGMLVIVTTPARSAWANRSVPAAAGLRRLLPTVLGTTFATALVLLFLQYGNALAHSGTDVVVAMTNLQGSTERIVTAMALTNLVLLVPLLTLARRWVLPPGTVTIVYAAACVLGAAVTGFDNAKLMAGVLLAGILVDLLAWRLRPGPDQPVRFRVFAAITPLVTWTSYLVTAYLTAPMPQLLGGLRQGPIVAHPVPELYAGAPAVQALIGLLLGVLLSVSPVPPAQSPPAVWTRSAPEHRAGTAGTPEPAGAEIANG